MLRNKRGAALALGLLLSGCTTFGDAEHRKAFARDLSDGLRVAEPLIKSQDGKQWVSAIRNVLDAVASGSGQIEWATLFRAVEAAEPAARTALMASGKSSEETEAIIALSRIALRHLEVELTGASST